MSGSIHKRSSRIPSEMELILQVFYVTCHYLARWSGRFMKVRISMEDLLNNDAVLRLIGDDNKKALLRFNEFSLRFTPWFKCVQLGEMMISGHLVS